MFFRIFNFFVSNLCPISNSAGVKNNVNIVAKLSPLAIVVDNCCHHWLEGELK